MLDQPPVKTLQAFPEQLFGHVASIVSSSVNFEDPGPTSDSAAHLVLVRNVQRKPPEPSKRTRHHHYPLLQSSILKCELGKRYCIGPFPPIVNLGQTRVEKMRFRFRQA